MLDKKQARRAAHLLLLVLCFAPLAVLGLDALRGALGADPVETIEHRTGDWARRLLLAALAVTPLRRLSGWSFLAPWRRSLGLFAFAYALLHFTIFLALDLEFDFGSLAREVAKRPYVTLGFSALLLLAPLALTSTRAWQRRLGRRWVSLHRLVYPAALLGVLHFVWLVKADLAKPLAYAAALAALLATRLLRVARA